MARRNDEAYRQNGDGATEASASNSSRAPSGGGEVAADEAVVEAPLMSGDGPIRPPGDAGKLDHFLGEVLATSHIFGGADDERPIAQGSEQRIGVVETTRHGHRCVGQLRGFTASGGGCSASTARRPSNAARTAESSPGSC